MIDYFKTTISEEEILAVSNTMRDGWITTGKKCAQFEREFLKHFGFNKDFDAIAVGANTHGLHLALDAYGFEINSEVIVPSMTFTASASSVVMSGLKPVIVDTNEENLITAEAIKKAITKNTVAIMVVHFAGKTANMDEIMELAKTYNLKVIEDAAHALPSKYDNGKWVGSYGNPAIFSFYANKTMTTGEGGMVISNDKELNKLIKIKRSHGMNKDVLDRFSGKPENWEYDISCRGYKYNLTDIASSIGIAQLKKSLLGQEKRKKIAMRYRNNLEDTNLIMTSGESKKGMHAYHLFQIRSKNNSAEFRHSLTTEFAKRNIGYSVHYKPLHRLSFWKDFVDNKTNFTNSDSHFSGCVSLPIYPDLSMENVDIISEVIKEVYFKNIK
tara:strand:+ start:3149 stop:4303 length:1155 start_codon:yes stop_codon:yes gene_type:complete